MSSITDPDDKPLPLGPFSSQDVAAPLISSSTSESNSMKPGLTTDTVRSLLREYYGLNFDGDIGVVGSMNYPGNINFNLDAKHHDRSHRSNPMDIDGNFFNPQSFFDHLLKEKDLASLIQYRNDLLQEVTSLENNSMRLVYENYDNLIQVDDVMQKLKKLVSELDGDKRGIQESFKSVQEKNLERMKLLGERKQEIVENTQRIEYLEQLRPVLEIPNSMRKASKEGKNGEKKLEQLHLQLMEWIHSLPDPSMAQTLKDKCMMILEEMKNHHRSK